MVSSGDNSEGTGRGCEEGNGGNGELHDGNLFVGRVGLVDKDIDLKFSLKFEYVRMCVLCRLQI